MNTDSILLVHPLGYEVQAASKDIARLANIMPPLGLASIAAFLDRRSLKSAIVDCFASPESERLIREHLLTHRPAWIGFSCTTSSFLDAIRIAQMARTVVPGISTVFGGPHVSALKEAVIERFPEVDFVVVGEGEETLAELMEAGPSGAGAVSGIVLREPDGPRFTGFRDKALDIDALPWPAYEKLAGFPGRYTLPIFSYPRAPNTTCISSRGCPYTCSYCDRSVFRRSFRFNSAEVLYEHLRYLHGRFKIRHVNFYDDNFTCHRGRIESFCRRMIDSPLKMTFNCAVRAEHVDLELMKLMKAAGCWMVSLGIETGDPELLAHHRQNPDLDLQAQRVREIHEAGLRAKGLFMMGLPGETEASIHRTLSYVKALRLDDVNLSKFTPFPGSPIYETIRDHGDFDEDWEKMDCMHFLFVPEGLSKERMETLFIEFYKAHYTRPRVLWNYFSMIWKSPDSWRRFMLNALDFWRFAHTDNRLQTPEKMPLR